jgi:hypothetical protein
MGGIQAWIPVLFVSGTCTSMWRIQAKIPNPDKFVCFVVVFFQQMNKQTN